MYSTTEDIYKSIKVVNDFKVDNEFLIDDYNFLPSFQLDYLQTTDQAM